MERTGNKMKVSGYFILIVVFLVIAALAGVYFISQNKIQKRHERGTFVYEQLKREVRV